MSSTTRLKEGIQLTYISSPDNFRSGSSTGTTFIPTYLPYFESSPIPIHVTYIGTLTMASKQHYTFPFLTQDELNKAALEHFIYQPVDRSMIAYLADATQNVISCDFNVIPTSSQPKSQLPIPPRTPTPSNDRTMPTLEELIMQLVVSSNVQVPTLMSTLVYLGRLKSKL